MGGRGGKLEHRERRDYKKFGELNDGTEKDEWFRQNSNSHDILKKGNAKNDPDQQGLEAYTGSAHGKMNSLMRGVTPYDPNKSIHQVNLERIQQTERKLDQATLSKGIEVQRGDTTAIFGKEGMTLEELKQYEGGMVQDNGFTSSSAANKPALSGPVRYVIQVPPGKGIGSWVDHVSRVHGEREFLMNSGSTFRIKKVEQEGNGFVVIMQYVGRYKLKSKEQVQKERGF